MDFNEFKEKMTNYLKDLEIELSEQQLSQFYEYMNMLIEWNKVMNLTGIIKPEEIITKHFVDSLMVLNKIKEKSTIIDVGTGAGFPGIPIKIAYPETKVVLLDSLNKRINFLEEVIKKLDLRKIKTVHGRAEDYGKNIEYREKFDIVIARAVAPLNVLIEYLIPFAKVEGKCICMKGPNLDEELVQGENAIKILGAKLIGVEDFYIPKTDIKRKIVEIKKNKATMAKYPRKAGTPTNNPL